MAIGRITGRMLKTPLERNSTDLVLSTDGHANTLKIDATNGRIGIRHSSPSHGLTVDGIGLNDNVIETIDSNADLELRASGSGAVSISGIKHPTSDGTVGQFLKTDGAGNLSFADLSLGDLTITGSEIATPSNADLTLVPGGTGSVVINSVSIRDNIIQTNESNANLQLSGNGTGTVLINSLAFPTGTGSNGQVMVSDGLGNLSFTDIATTLDAVTTNGATTANAVTVGGLTSNGNVVVNGEISSADSTAIQINDGVNISGVLSANTIDTNVISSSDSSAIQFNDAINVNGDITTTGTVQVDRLSLSSDQTTVPPLQLTANSLQDGVGALRIDGSQADIYLNPSTATHTTVTFAVNDDQRLAFGMDNNSDFYITRRTGGSWYDDTLVIDRDTGELRYGYDVSVSRSLTVQGTTFTDRIQSTGSNADIVLDPQGTGVVRIKSNILPDTTTTYDIGSDSLRFNDIYLAGTTVDIGGTKLSKNADGDVEIKDSSDVRKKIIVDEVHIGSGANKIKLARGANGKLKKTNENDVELPIITVVGDDSTGTDFNTGEDLKIAGGTNITTAMSGDTLTITGPDLTSYVQSNDSPTFTDLTVSGNLTVSGTTTYVDTTNLLVEDPLLLLSKNNSAGSDVDSGIIIERGSAGNNAAFYWNEGDDKFKAVLTTSGHDATAVTDSSTATVVANIEGNVTGNVTGNADTATTLATARSIAGQSFDGSGDITIASTDLSDTSSIALLTSTQTLTNKTLTSPTINAATMTGSVVVDNLTLNDNIISTSSNADLVLDPGGTGSIDVSSAKIINLADPTADQHAATKAYVDTQISSNVSSPDLDWGSVTSSATVTEDFGVLDGSTEADTFIDYGSVSTNAVISSTSIVDQSVSSEKIEDGALIARHIDTTSLVLYKRWEVKTASFVAVNGGQYFADTTGGAITVTLPASPSVGDHVSIIDSHANAGTNNITIDRNGSNIMGSATNDVLNVNDARRHLAYVDSTRGWIKVDGNT